MPFYQSLTQDDFRSRIETGNKILTSCTLCPRNCKIDRTKGGLGFCKAGLLVKVNSAFPHHGEEPPLSGTRGSGTIFFSYCTLRCIFCQNYQISWNGSGEEMTNTQLADEMLLLQQKGCHNINLVTPSHFLPQILEALLVAIERGLKLPIVYNTSGYESPETLKLLDGIVDIYLPDIKYANNNYSKKYSSCNDYSEHNRRALREMWRQVGPLITDEHGIAVQGMIVRHLVLPESIAGTIESIQWMASELSGEVAISLMAQYNPLHNSADFPEINRRISREEYFSAVGALHEAGLGEGWIQDWEGMDGRYIIDFLKRKRERLQ